MRLTDRKWKEFKIKDIMIIINGKGLTSEEIEENQGAIPCVQGGESNNGSIGLISKSYCNEQGYIIIDEQCLTVARVGTAGCVNYWEEPCAIGDKCKALILKSNKTKAIYIFLQTILNQLQYKYSYGRGLVTDKYMTAYIKLPVDSSGNPDWQFMEDYIKSLHHKPLTTKNKPGQAPDLNVQNWKEFRVGDILNCDSTILSIKDDLLEGEIPFVSRTAGNNGIDGHVEIEPDKLTDGNCLTIGAEGIYAFYQPEPFATGNKVYQMRRPNMNQYISLFLSTVLNLEYYKYSYGRARIMSKIKEEIIKLPVDSSGNPDWQFMENYIKALPYGDRLL